MIEMLRNTTLLSLLLLPFCTWGQLDIEVTAYSTRCNGSSTGLVEMTILEASGNVMFDSSLDFEALPAGDYAIEASDEAGNAATVSFTILDHPAVCGCIYPQAFNFNNSAEVDNGTCVFATDETCLADIVPDGIVGTNDLLQLLVEFGTSCE
jgi:hypothetical protein